MQLADRISYDGDLEFVRIHQLLKEPSAPIFNANMDHHFVIAKSKPDNFINHEKVLAISIGGTYVKAMIASMENGELIVEYIRSLVLPEKTLNFDEFFDFLVFEDKEFSNYMYSSPTPQIGVSFPMSVIGDVAYHPTKVPGLSGVIARDFDRDAPTHNFRQNLYEYLNRRGINKPELFFQGDGIVAHHGVLSLSDIDPNDKTSLIICGTGLATGDEANYIQMGILTILNYDEELFPKIETENYQIHYAMAGKGIFSLMKRALLIKAKESSSSIDPDNFDKLFIESKHSKIVSDIWKTTLGQPPTAICQQIIEVNGMDAFKELQDIAAKIIDRTIRSIANSLVATIVKMKPAENGRGHHLYFEGGICTDKDILPRVKRQIESIISNKNLFDLINEPQPYMPDLDPVFRSPRFSDKAANQSKDFDISLMGTATMIMAHTS